MGGHHKTPVQTGTRWGKLVVGKPIMKNESSQVQWEVKCDCGKKIRVWGYNLVKGNKVDCGCVRAGLRKEI